MRRTGPNRFRFGVWLAAAVFLGLLAASAIVVPPPWVTASDDQDLQPQTNGSGEERGGGRGPRPIPEEEEEGDFTNSIGMKFKLIPAGSFMMGSEEDSDEQPVHQVTITNSFYLGIYEVTQAQWVVVMGSNPSYLTDDSRPVEQVSWYDVQDFIAQLNDLEGTDKYRLPTEAEWEYACRAGSTTAYCFGDDESQLTQYAWYRRNAFAPTHPVGQKLPNAWGLYDMPGNVWEWCADWYGSNYYSSSPGVDPQGPGSGSDRVMRGGSWLSGAGACRSAYRYWNVPDYRDSSFGFRLARITP